MSTAHVPAGTAGPATGEPVTGGPLPFRDPALPGAERVEDLLSRLTPRERVAMLHQHAPAVPRLGLAPFRTGSEALHGVAWLGTATVFPQAVGIGASWDEDLAREVGAAAATELRAFHHHRQPADGLGPVSLQAWAPVVNPLRDPRWGRNEEGYSEDALACARLGDAYCRGLAGDDPDRLRTAPVLKHFLAYNNEDDRCTTSSGLRPRVLHEYELTAFRRPVAGGAATGVMAAYNLVNGRPCHVSPLIAEELRRSAEPTGHELFVVSDAQAPSNLVDPQRYFTDHVAAHAAALRAGIDSFTDNGADPGPTVARIGEALERGLITMADVDRAVRRQLSIRLRLGELDPEPGPYAATGWEVVGSCAHRALALRAATESVVLLKNDGGTLPLAGTGALAVVGPLADGLFEDWYSGTMPYRITVAEGLAAAAGARGGAVEAVEGVDRVALRAASTGGLLTATGEAGLLRVSDTATGDPAAQFDVFDWDLGVLTLRNAATGRYASLRDGDGTVAADRSRPGGWDVHETFRLEPAADGAELIRSVLTGRYAVLDPVSGTLAVTERDPRRAERFTRTVVRDGVAAAVEAAARAGAAVVVLGNDPHINGRETQDRAGLRLPPSQERLLRAVAAVAPRTVLVVMSSYPYAVDWADAHLPAALWTSHGGQETGRALAAVLLGDAEPAGRLPQTWYRGDDELPSRLDYDIVKAGWTYQYHRAAPLYPFGHGLSYTEMACTDLRLSASRVAVDGSGGRAGVEGIGIGGVTATVTVTNTGTRPGTEIVQLYVRALDARHEAPLLKLAGFGKVRLAPGASREVAFELDLAEALAHWSVAAGAFTVDPGRYEVLVARSAGHILLSAPLTVTGPAPLPRALAGRRVAAVDFDDYESIRLVDATRERGDAVAPAGREEGLLLYRDVDLDGVRGIVAEVSRTGAAGTDERGGTSTSSESGHRGEADVMDGSGGAGGACLEVWADAAGPGGVLLASLTVPATGGRYAWTTVSTPLAVPIAGVHDLHLVLRGEQRLAGFTGTL